MATSIFSQRNFVKLWAGQLLSQPAGHILNFLLVIRIFQITGNNFYVSLLIALVSIPPILFSTTAGVVADHYNRKWVMFASNLIRAFIVIGFLFFGDWPVAILILAFLVSAVSQFFGPSENASIPTMTSRETLFQANSVFLFTTYAAFLVGYSLAGPMLFFLGEQLTYGILIALYVLAMVANLLLPPLNQHIDPADHEAVLLSFRRMFEKVREAVVMVWHHKVLLFTVFQLSFVFALERAVIALVPDLATSAFVFDITQISYFIITPVGLGAFFGAFIANRLKRVYSKRALIIWGILIDGLVLVLMPLYGNVSAGVSPTAAVALIVVLSFLSGLADVVIITAAQTHLHELSKPEVRGRLFGSLTTFLNIVGLPFILIIGAIADFLPVLAVVFSLGILLIVGGLASYFVHTRYGSGRPTPYKC